MKIDGLVTCVGDRYKKYLLRSLPIWADTLDSVTVLTDELWALHRLKSNVNVIMTDIFTMYGASFNKGAALSHGFTTIAEPQWILNFDADIEPPKDWREKSEPFLVPGKLFGCSRRYDSNESLIPDSPFPDLWGFFHLWNVDDPHSWKRPVYPVDCGHAGNYDHTFLRQWPENARVDLSPVVRLVHHGEPRTAWFGRDPHNDRKMVNLFTLGLWEAWFTRAGHVKVPEPEVDETMDATLLTLAEVRTILRRYTDPDPFRYKLELKPPCLNMVADA